MITGKTLVEWGFPAGKWFKDGIKRANELRGEGIPDQDIFNALQAMIPVEIGMRTNKLPFDVLLEPENDLERSNLEAVVAHMDALMRVPTVVAGAVMPDACPSGQQEGTIPVGGVVATKNAIHPGMHSSDICCSVAISVFKRDIDPKLVLDAVHESTHFGPGGRPHPVNPFILRQDSAPFEANPFLKGLENYAIGHFGSQGDGNHFAFVGTIKSTGQVAIVTHHGSRGLGAQLYKRGMAVAKRHTAIHAPKIPAHNAWIDADSADGEAYWDALQVVRAWTKRNHFAIHDTAALKLGARVDHRFWNEHNFVFRKSDGLFYHGKGATPSWSGFAEDDSGLTLIPLNMSEPILITRHSNNHKALGFAPHGAGRNMGRRAFLKQAGDMERELAELKGQGLDIRSYCGTPDHSELPSAYKNAASVRGQIEKFGLAEIVDEVIPYGSVMAGDWEKDAPWRKR